MQVHDRLKGQNMAGRCASVGVLAVFLAGTVQATELDRVRELDRARQNQRAAFEFAFTKLGQLEPDRIAAEHGGVVRNGGELALALSGGRWTYFHNETVWCLSGVIPARSDGCVDFYFVGHPVPRFYLLRAHYAEGSDFRLVDAGNGHPTNIPAEPQFSADQKHFVTVSAAIAYDPVGIEIWQVTPDAPALIWKHVPSQFALYHFVTWRGDDDVLLDVETYVDHELKRLPARLRLGTNGWTLQGPVEASQY